MSAITDNNQVLLRQVASNAYGSGWFEGKKGGAGNIGLLNGKVVKFNTHFGERDGVVSRQMQDSSNALRLKLYRIAETATRGGKSQQLETFRKMLGLELTDDGVNVKAKGLLDRTVAAKFLSKLAEVDGFDAWSDGQGGQVAAARTLEHSKFKDVRLENLSDPVRRQIRAKVDSLVNEIVADKTNEQGNPISCQTRELLARILLKCTATHALMKARLDADGKFLLDGVNWQNDLTFLLLRNPIIMKDHLVLSLANDLPPLQATRFLEACARMGDLSKVPGLSRRLHAVAGQLANMPFENIYCVNIVKLVYPELKLTETRRNSLRRSIDDLCGWVQEAAGLDSWAGGGGSALWMELGLSISDLRTLVGDPAKFTKKMLPPGAYYFATPDQRETGEGLVGDFSSVLKDMDRNPRHVLFRGQDGKRHQAVGDPKAMLRQVEELCGKERRDLMKTNVARFLSADAFMFDKVLTGCFLGSGAAFEPVTSVTFERQDDGSVVGTRECLLSGELRSQWKVRFHPDGKVETLDFGWRKLSETDKNVLFRNERENYEEDTGMLFQESISNDKLRNDLKSGTYKATENDLRRGTSIHVGDSSYGIEQFGPNSTAEQREIAMAGLKHDIGEIAGGDEALAKFVLDLSNQCLSIADKAVHDSVHNMSLIGGRGGLEQTDFSYSREKNANAVRIRMDRALVPRTCMDLNTGTMTDLDATRSFIDSHVEVVVTRLEPEEIVEAKDKTVFEDSDGNRFRVKIDAARSYRVCQLSKAEADKAQPGIGS